MKKKLLLVIILIVLAFLPPILGALLSSTGTGIFPLDFILFAVLPIIVIVFLLHFLFKLPSDLPAAKKATPAVDDSKAEEAVNAAKAAKAEKAAEKAAKAAKKEKAAKKAAAKAAKAKAEAKAAKAAKKEKPAKAEKAPRPSKAEKATAVAAANELPDEEVKLEDLSASEPAITSEPEVNCPECGGKVTMFDPVCPHCGVKFESEEEGPAIVKEQMPAEEEPAPEEILPAEEPVVADTLSLDIPEEPKADIISDFGLKCPTCGGKVSLEEKFCPHCGADFEQKILDMGAETEKSEAELDAMFGIAPDEVKEEAKPDAKPEEKPATESTGEITLSYEEPVAEVPAPKPKKGKKKK